MHGAIFLTLVAAAAFMPSLRVWPLLWMVPLLAYAVLVLAVRPLRASFRPWCFGDVSPRAIWATVAISLVSCAVLIAFHLLIRPDVSAYGDFIPLSVFGSV